MGVGGEGGGVGGWERVCVFFVVVFFFGGGGGGRQLNIYILCTTLLPIFILLTCSNPVVSMYLQSAWKTKWIMIRWLIWIYSVYKTYSHISEEIANPPQAKGK